MCLRFNMRKHTCFQLTLSVSHRIPVFPSCSSPHHDCSIHQLSQYVELVYLRFLGQIYNSISVLGCISRQKETKLHLTLLKPTLTLCTTFCSIRKLRFTNTVTVPHDSNN